MKQIPFNKPYISGKELQYIKAAMLSGKVSGDGIFTKKCQKFFANKFGLERTLLTTSCTDALEMAAILVDIKEGDEVIMPSYTFVSTANAFVLRGAKIVFADSSRDHPGVDINSIESLVTSRTKAIVPVHYAGVACDMDPIMKLARRHGIIVVEDAAQAIGSYYKSQPLGSLGHLAAFSFHETKNIISGEGGMLVVNDDKLYKRAEIIRQKGTNRSAFFRGEVDKYSWVDIGSSFLPSDINAAFLWAQLENIDKIQGMRRKIWEKYYSGLKVLEEDGLIRLPHIPDYATNNYHMFYLICESNKRRNLTIGTLKKNGIMAIFHYVPLHDSPYFRNRHDGRNLKYASYYSDCIVRLPFYCELGDAEIKRVIKSVKDAFALPRS